MEKHIKKFPFKVRAKGKHCEQRRAELLDLLIRFSLDGSQKLDTVSFLNRCS